VSFLWIPKDCFLPIVDKETLLLGTFLDQKTRKLVLWREETKFRVCKSTDDYSKLVSDLIT
jgi:hypothetical protein